MKKISSVLQKIDSFEKLALNAYNSFNKTAQLEGFFEVEKIEKESYLVKIRKILGEAALKLEALIQKMSDQDLVAISDYSEFLSDKTKSSPKGDFIALLELKKKYLEHIKSLKSVANQRADISKECDDIARIILKTDSEIEKYNRVGKGTTPSKTASKKVGRQNNLMKFSQKDPFVALSWKINKSIGIDWESSNITNLTPSDPESAIHNMRIYDKRFPNTDGFLSFRSDKLKSLDDLCSSLLEEIRQLDFAPFSKDYGLKEQKNLTELVESLKRKATSKFNAKFSEYAIIESFWKIFSDHLKQVGIELDLKKLTSTLVSGSRIAYIPGFGTKKVDDEKVRAELLKINSAVDYFTENKDNLIEGLARIFPGGLSQKVSQYYDEHVKAVATYRLDIENWVEQTKSS